MDKERLKAERSSIDDRQRRSEALANPQNFYPRPGDVLDDDTLSADEKRELLCNWQVQVEDRAGVLDEPGGPGEDQDGEGRELHRAILDALDRVGEGDGHARGDGNHRDHR